MRKDFYIFKRGSVWYVQYPLDSGGRTVARSTGQTNKTAAEKWARFRVPVAGSPEITFGDWQRSFFTSTCPHVSRLRAEGRTYSDQTEKANRRRLDKLKADPIHLVMMGELKRSDILALRDRVLAKLGKTRTAQATMQAVSIVVREALFRGTIQSDPFLGVGKIAYDEKVRHDLDDNTLRKVLNPASYHNKRMYEATLCAALTGMRAGEVRALQWGDIGSVIQIRRAAVQNHGSTKAPKWGKTRVCPYPKALSDALEPRRGKPDAWVFGVDTPLGYKAWADTVRKLGATLHQLRHTLNTRLLSAGIPSEVIRGAFGWSDPKVQDGYTHAVSFDYSPQAQAIDAIFKEATNEAKGD